MASLRSLYLRILLASLGTVAVALAAFVAISRTIIERTTARDIPALHTLQLEQAVEAFESGGPPKLAAFLARLDTSFSAHHFLTDSRGIDLVNGADRSRLFNEPRGRPQWVDERLIVVWPSTDNRYSLIASLVPQFTLWTFAPYLALIVVSILFISWLVAIRLAAPLHTLAAAVQRFGQGDFSIRVDYSGTDEIGQLANAFNLMAERLQTLVTSERRLLQDISHELRSPLARLRFGIELVRTATDRNRAVDQLKREAVRLGTLVDQLLEVTSAEGDPESRRIEPVDVAAVVAEVVQACRLDAAARGCEIIVDSTTTQMVLGNEELLRRAIENVLRNAIRHAPAGTAVDVHVCREGTTTAVSIRDRGPGVPADLLDKIFEPFYRVDPSRTSATGGVGLGLAITARAIRLHQGRIAAENADPGLRIVLAIPASAP